MSLFKLKISHARGSDNDVSGSDVHVSGTDKDASVSDNDLFMTYFFLLLINRSFLSK